MSSGASRPGEVLFVGGTIWTGTGEVEALAVRDGEIVAMGADAAHSLSAGPRVHDLDGGFLMAGFGDGHAHPTQAGLAQLLAPVRDHESVESLVAAVGAWAAANPDEAWVRGDGYDPALAPGGEFDARWLDEVVPDRPVVLRASDYHTAWVNTRALELCGITAGTPEPADGVIVRRADGSPMGTLREWGAWGPVLDKVPPLTAEQRTAAVTRAMAGLSSSGIVWVQDAWVERDTLDMWLEGLAAGALTVRVNLGLRMDPEGWPDQLGALDQMRSEVVARDSELLSANTVKFFADGIIEGGTAAMLDDYCDCPSKGLPTWAPDELAAAVSMVVAAGYQPHIHAIGDAGIRAALDACQLAVTQHGHHGRAVIAHTQLVDPADLPRFAALGVIANFEPLWACLDPAQTELTLPRIGAARGDRQYPIASLLRSGAAISFGSDWPVSSQVPLEGIAVAVTRQTPDGQPPGGWLPSERLTVEQALLAYTAGVAHQAGEDGRWGVLRPGARADLVVLGADPRVAEPLDIAGIPVLGTWLAGRQVFSA